MIGIICAMESEVQAILSRMKDTNCSKIAGTTFYQGTLGDQPVVAALSGVGKVAAAMASTLMCQCFQPQALINVGVAGGLKEDQKVTDLIVSEQAVQADFDTSPLDGPSGIGLVFQTDPNLQKKALAAAEKLNIPAKKGVIASQDLFMSRTEDYERLMKLFPQAACSEMEGGAVAQVADAFAIPVLIIRTLSDVVSHQDNPMEFSQFAAIAAQRAGEFMEAFCTEE